jgi:hypothetical protein
MCVAPGEGRFRRLFGPLGDLMIAAGAKTEIFHKTYLIGRADISR